MGIAKVAAFLCFDEDDSLFCTSARYRPMRLGIHDGNIPHLLILTTHFVSALTVMGPAYRWKLDPHMGKEELVTADYAAKRLSAKHRHTTFTPLFFIISKKAEPTNAARDKTI
jgi:hypothetical protein